MAMIQRYGVEKNINSMAGLSAYENGGKGSGNFGHKGRPGEVGGSALVSVGTKDYNDKEYYVVEPSFIEGIPSHLTSQKYEVEGYVEDEVWEKGKYYFAKDRGDGRRNIERYDGEDEDGHFQWTTMEDGVFTETMRERDELYGEAIAKQEAKLQRIKEKVGGEVDIKSDQLPIDEFSMRLVRFKDKDGKEYSYDSRTEELISGGERLKSPSEKKADADKEAFATTGAEIKKKLKEYGINTDGLKIRKDSGGLETAWYVEGSGTKTDLASVEKILTKKLGHIDYDEATGDILAGGNTFIFVNDTDEY